MDARDIYFQESKNRNVGTCFIYLFIRSPPLFRVQVEDDIIRAKEQRVQKPITFRESELGTTVLALFPTSDYDWTTFYYPAKITAIVCSSVELMM